MTKLQSRNPGRDYQLVGEIETSSPEYVEQKVAAARAATHGWKMESVKARVAALESLYEVFSERREEIAGIQTLEVGKPIVESRLECDDALLYFRWYLDHAEELLAPQLTFEDEQSRHTLSFDPLGVAAVIIPWNFPFCNFVWGVIPNLLAGNTVVLKHSEECPMTGQILEKMVELSRIPAGVFSEVYGNAEVGESLVHSGIDLIWFTGSTAVGRKLSEYAGARLIRIVLELGGSAAGVVFDDVNTDEVAEQVFSARYFNCGQVCDGLKRLIVHESVASELVDKLSAVIASKKLGDPEDEGTEVGPLVARRQLDLLMGQVEDAMAKGGKVIGGGSVPAGLHGAYFVPAVITQVTPDMRVWQEEVFGPVLPVMTFRTEQEALQLANATEYGLGGYVFCRDKDRAERVASGLETGAVSINGANYVQPCNPFGGRKQSGSGREHGPYAFHDLCQTKIVAADK